MQKTTAKKIRLEDLETRPRNCLSVRRSAREVAVKFLHKPPQDVRQLLKKERFWWNGEEWIKEIPEIKPQEALTPEEIKTFRTLVKQNPYAFKDAERLVLKRQVERAKKEAEKLWSLLPVPKLFLVFGEDEALVEE